MQDVPHAKMSSLVPPRLSGAHSFRLVGVFQAEALLCLSLTPGLLEQFVLTDEEGCTFTLRCNGHLLNAYHGGGVVGYMCLLYTHLLEMVSSLPTSKLPVP